jgi:hypothetical protein
MTVCLTDKRRHSEKIPCVEMPNHTWFCVLDIPVMDALVDTAITPIQRPQLHQKLKKWLFW